MPYLPSESVNGFPLVNRQKTQISAALITESSIANLINKLIQTDGFIITEDIVTNGKVFEFNIFGYYFQVLNTNSSDNGAKVIQSLFTNETEIYARIGITYPQGTQFYYELVNSDFNSDSNSFYGGLEFVSSIENDSQNNNTNIEYKYLHLFTRTNSNDSWKLSTDSLFRFNSNYASLVDGGEVN